MEILNRRDESSRDEGVRESNSPVVTKESVNRVPINIAILHANGMEQNIKQRPKILS